MQTKNNRQQNNKKQHNETVINPGPVALKQMGATRSCGTVM